jgi:hypothetical protein
MPDELSWRNGNESSGEDDESEVRFAKDCSKSQPVISLDQVIRQDLCGACDKKFCTGCAPIEPARANTGKAVKPIEIVKFVKNFRMIRRPATLSDASSALISFKGPFLIPKRWPGSIIACALMASNEIPGDISCTNKPQKVEILVFFNLLHAFRHVKAEADYFNYSEAM